MAGLIDVNALIALVDQDHTGHKATQTWFTKHHERGWATCPIVENGMVRVLSQPSYPSGARRPTEVVDVLASLETTFAQSYEFWPDTLSITDHAVFKGTLIAGSRQVTDVYLLAVALRRKGTSVSFDRSLAWQAVRRGSKSLVQHPG